MIAGSYYVYTVITLSFSENENKMSNDAHLMLTICNVVHVLCYVHLPMVCVVCVLCEVYGNVKCRAGFSPMELYR